MKAFQNTTLSKFLLYTYCWQRSHEEQGVVGIDLMIYPESCNCLGFRC